MAPILKVSKHGPGFRLSHKVLPPGTDLPLHRHAVHSLSLVLEGAYEERFEGARQFCPRGGLQFKPRGVPHTTSAGERGGRLFILAFRGALEPGRPLARSGRVLQWEPGLAAALALRLWAAAFGEEDAPAARLQGQVTALLARLQEPLGEVPAWLREAEQRVRARPARASLSPVARALGVHPVHLARRFRRHFGCSLGTYARRARIDAAVRRLVAEAPPLSQLALTLGYCDQSHFTNDFRRETGWTPARFRRAAGGWGPGFGSSKS